MKLIYTILLGLAVHANPLSSATAGTASTAATASEPALPLLYLSQQEGIRLLQQNLTPNATRLLSHYVTQQTPSLCGAASAVMILNSSSVAAPHDPWRYHYFTQDNFFSDEVESVVRRYQVDRRGMLLQELGLAIASWGLPTRVVPACELTLPAFRTLLRDALEGSLFVIADFSRETLAQLGGGHHSPVAAYDAETDQFLILDVARYKHIPFWVKTTRLWDAINTTDDEGHCRGVALICPPVASLTH
jgi:hypothetical protein